VHNNNEKRLLHQRVREVAAVLTTAIGTTQNRLATTANVVEATSADNKSFTRTWKPAISAGQPFTSISIWPGNEAAPRPIVVVGKAPTLARQSAAAINAYFDRVRATPSFAINDQLNTPSRTIGYGAVASPQSRYVVYGEAQLPHSRRARIDKNSAFSDLNYALFLGTQPNADALLASSTGGTTLHGRTSSATVPFGDSQLLIEMSPTKDLGGSLLENLWWILLLLGLALTAGATTLVERLTRETEAAEELAQENADLYATQRSVALTLQHSLLLEDLPVVAGAEIGARYVSGVEGIDVGGDWYDVVALDDASLLLAVGDVSGRGLRAATTMASLRFAIRAYAAQHDSPGTILTKLSELVNIGRDGQFATTLCAVIDLRNQTLTCANAGHPEPLLITGSDVQFVATSVGVPIGVRHGFQYEEQTHALPARGTLLMYTDGLIERRGETLDIGFARLRDAARTTDGSLQETLSAVLGKAIPQGSADDTALLGVRWNS
jgi:serine phosphatase RsbU (regulator of sigma subunit)